MNRLTILATTGVVVLAAGIIIPTTAYAGDSYEGTFVEKVATRLGISAEDVDLAIVEAREEQREENMAERQEKIDEALENGDLTQKQTEILEAMHDANKERIQERQELRDSDCDGDQERMQERKEEREQLMLQDLNEDGLDVTQEELDELRDTMQDLNLGFRGGVQNKGIRMGM